MGDTLPFLAPFEAGKQLASLGVKEGNILSMCPNRVRRVGDFTIRTTLSIPFGPDDLNHVGYLIEVENGPRIYFTGDTDFNDILALQVAPYQPDVLVVVINPAFRNLSPAQAAILARDVKPRWVVPCHHDLFPDNSLPDRLLKTNLIILGLGEKFCPLKYGEVRIFREKKKRQPLAGPND
jgi:L-ascorbate 6-phosphate lactonase